MERELIRWLRARLPQRDNILIGPGDDAAVLRLARDSVVTTDMLMDGVDFILSEVDPRRVGRKALAVNLSDLAAMAARPVAAFVSLALPQSGGEALTKLLYEGMLPLAEEFGCSIAGGDINSWNGPLVINVTAIGESTPRGPLLRSAAKANDAILVTGELGNSIAGHHFDFTPRVREALALHEQFAVHAGIDISDGLSLDLARLCEESDCGAVLDAAALPRRNHCSLVQALGDGEDFELLFTLPVDEAERLLHSPPFAQPQLSRIGQIIAEPGLWLRDERGQLQPLVPRGFEHKLKA